eukprot:jgi/Psemu1/325530/estExt_fgenesh1_pg.C_2510017
MAESTRVKPAFERTRNHGHGHKHKHSHNDNDARARATNADDDGLPRLVRSNDNSIVDTEDVVSQEEREELIFDFEIDLLELELMEMEGDFRRLREPEETEDEREAEVTDDGEEERKKALLAELEAEMEEAAMKSEPAETLLREEDEQREMVRRLAELNAAMASSEPADLREEVEQQETYGTEKERGKPLAELEAELEAEMISELAGLLLEETDGTVRLAIARLGEDSDPAELESNNSLLSDDLDGYHEALRLELEHVDANHEFIDDGETETVAETAVAVTVAADSEEALRLELEHVDANHEFIDDQETDTDTVSVAAAVAGEEALRLELEHVDANHEFIDDQETDTDTVAAAGEEYHRRETLTDADDSLRMELREESSASSPSPSSSSSLTVSSSPVLLFSSTKFPDHCQIQVVDIYETHSTQLKPRSLSEREQEYVPLEKAGIPFRKCRDRSCACHSSSSSPRPRSRPRPRPHTARSDPGGSNSIVGRSNRSEMTENASSRRRANSNSNSDHATNNNNDDDDAESSPPPELSFYTRRAERKHAMRIYEEQDDRTETTAENSESTTTRSATSSASFVCSGQQQPPNGGTSAALDKNDLDSNHRMAIHRDIIHAMPDHYRPRQQRARSEDVVDGNDRTKSWRQRSYSSHVTTPVSTTNNSNDGLLVVPDDPGDKDDNTERDKTSSVPSPVNVVEDVRHDHRSSSERKPPKEGQRTSPVKKRRQSKPKKTPPKQVSECYQERERALGHCRRTIEILHHNEMMERRKSNRRPGATATVREVQLRRRRCLQQAMELTKVYYQMGLLHYQQGRYDTARHVLEHGLEVLIADRANNIVPPVAAAAAAAAVRTKPHTSTTTEEDAMFDADYNDARGNFGDSSPRGFGNTVENLSPLPTLPPLPTLDEVAPYFSNQVLLLAADLVLAVGKIFAAQGLFSDAKRSTGRILQWSACQRQRMFQAQQQSHEHCQFHYHYYPNNNELEYWREWGPITARAQVLFAECFARENRPDLAMTYYQEALSVQRSILGPRHVQVAETVYRIGNVHASRGFLELAELWYHEALGLYRCHRENGGSNEAAEASHDTTTETASILADEATVLASLGWIFLLRREADRAYWATDEALKSTIHSLGPSHRNVASLQYQMACIQSLYR